MTKTDRHVRLLTRLLLTTTLLNAVSSHVIAQVRSEATRPFNIKAQSLEAALRDFTRQSGVQVGYERDDVARRQAEAVSGYLSPEEALSRLLSGSGLTYRFAAAQAVRLEKGTKTSSGAIQLGTIRVEGGGEGEGTLTGSGDIEGDDTAPYRTAGGRSHISQAQIEHYRGSSPADIFRGTPGVMSGEARNGAGAIDVNIRGLQGMGRVTTTIDGAENAVTVYQGYQGVSNRTFVDPDFIAGIDITKGADVSSFGNAGSVSMRTLDAGDIVKPGQKWGLRLRGGFGTNTSDPVAGNMSGIRIDNPIGSLNNPTSGYGKATPSLTGMDRPAKLKPTSGSASVIAAFRGENIELLAGYAFRDQGNYHAGEHGPAASAISTGPRAFCYSNGTCPTLYTYRDYIENIGIVNYRAGEEVLNTELRTESWLTKMTAQFGDGNRLQMGYTGFRSEAGDRIASRLTGNTAQAVQQAQTAGTRLDTITARYGYKPAGNDLIDLKANLYWSHLELRNPVRGGRLARPQDIGLPADFRVGSDTNMWGADVSNRSQFFLADGDLYLSYGLAYRAEDTRGSRHTQPLEGWMTPRDAIRNETGAFAKAEWTAAEWVTLNAGLRYTHYWSKDRFDPYERQQIVGKSVLKRNDGGLSPSVGVTFQPSDWAQIYVNYASMLRMPSIIETVSAFNSVVSQPDLKPERSDNWEIGTNLTRGSLFRDSDRAMIKLGYFDWTVKDYLARDVYTEPTITLNVNNIHRARFTGTELSMRYETGGLTGELAANYYHTVEFCRTAGTCESKSLYGDYATNQVPPEYSVTLNLTQKVLKERLTLGGRVAHTGPRAIGHGDETARGAASFIALVDWKPYTLVDVFADYKISDRLTASLRVENLTDRFYIDPLGLVTQPGPGRTVYASLTSTFGGAQPLPWLPDMGFDGKVTRNWTGAYAGVSGGGNLMKMRGTATRLDGSASAAAARESAREQAGSGVFGLLVGYNYQFANRFVWGGEIEAGKTWLHDSEKVRSTNATLAATGQVDAALIYDIDWTASLKARLGYAVNDRLMVYGTGGLVLAKETQWRDQYISDTADATQPLGRETTVFFVEKAESTRSGYTVGFGTEHALGNRWSLSVDYSYMDFGKTDYSFDKARAGTGKDYEQTVANQIGTQILQPSRPPEHPTCARPVPAIQCAVREVPVYEYITTKYTGSSNSIEGRKASNRLNMHAVKVSLKFRF